MDEQIYKYLNQLDELAEAKHAANMRWTHSINHTNNAFMISLFGSAKLNYKAEIQRLAVIRWQQRIVNISEKLFNYTREILIHIKTN